VQREWLYAELMNGQLKGVVEKGGSGTYAGEEKVVYS